ncbi:hypothetical protein CMQ_4132 [Grosmannia clavigera kw1407]|uniref:Rhodopsin domain-containing protein n=1 Tax=Grosmannia clavigera (strain kw1407 / UAMH 11150) TaxID=655863 RepID=F0XA87_GROCL|nr:uncharacterized protein CMQ_4132 [Grosmannia clavigera kw1407]EFX06063.1 hypothetical protein CMQ_4132 [Grosmannia clavigera kw1407]
MPASDPVHTRPDVPFRLAAPLTQSVSSGAFCYPGSGVGVSAAAAVGAASTVAEGRRLSHNGGGSTLLAAVVGFGVDIWTLSPGAIEKALLAFYIAEILYLVILTLARLSVLCLYLHLFAPLRTSCRGGDSRGEDGTGNVGLNMDAAPATSPSWGRCGFQIAALAIAVWLVIAGTVFLFLDVFQCWPVDTVWRFDFLSSSSPPSPRCLPVGTVACAAAACGIAQDAVILVLPLPELVQLWRRLPSAPAPVATATTAVMFSLSVVVLATSAVRLRFLVRFGRSANPTWDDTDSLVWSGVEVSATVVVASVPAIRAAVRQWWKRRGGGGPGE